jgi:uncharacterized protein (DUF2147 family)
MKNMFVRIFSMAVIVLMATSPKAFAQNVAADAVIGQYWSPKKDAKIEIFKSGNKYFGKFIWGSNPTKDTKNPKKELRSRDLVGLTFLSNFTFDDGSYIDGTIYDPESGKTYSSKMKLENGNLKVRGYVGLSMFGRTETFERIK